MAETLSTVSIVLYGAAVLFLILSVFFFFFFRIPSVIGDLSGRTARKSIARNRLKNEKSGNKSYRPSDTNKKRGKLTESISPTDKPERQGKTGKGRAAREEKKELVFATMDDRPETGLLNENRGVSSAGTNETSTLEGTEVLSDNGDSCSATTDFLDSTPQSAKTFSRSGGVKLTILDQVILIHTDEVIN